MAAVEVRGQKSDVRSEEVNDEAQLLRKEFTECNLERAKEIRLESGRPGASGFLLHSVSAAYW